MTPLRSPLPIVPLLFGLLAALLASSVPVASSEPNLEGNWNGVIEVAGSEIPVVFQFENAGAGKLTGIMLSPSQTDAKIPLTAVSLFDRKVNIAVDIVGGSYEGKMSARGDTIHGEWTQGGFTTELELEHSDEAFAYDRPQTPKPPFPYRSEKVRFPNSLGRIELGGTLTIPQDTVNPVPAVVLISGSGPQDRDETIAGHKPFAVIADYLTRRGIAVLRYDDRGVGDSNGTFEFGTTLDFATDAWAAVEYLRTQRAIDPKRIGLIGHSEGGLIAPIVATKREDVAFLVLLAGPGLTGDLTLLTQTKAIGEASGLRPELISLNQRFLKSIYEVLTEPDPDLAALEILGKEFEKEIKNLAAGDLQAMGEIGPLIEQQVKMIESPWFAQFLKLDPAAYLGRVSVPVLAVIGEHDMQVLPDLHLPAIEAALKANPQASPRNVVEEIPGVNHLFQKTENGLPGQYSVIEETISPSVLRKIADWIDDLP